MANVNSGQQKVTLKQGEDILPPKKESLIWKMVLITDGLDPLQPI